VNWTRRGFHCSSINDDAFAFELAGPKERTQIYEFLFRARELGLHELCFESNGDLVADQNATSLERSVPRQAEVLAVDLCARRDRNSGVAPGVLRRWSWPFNREADLAGNATDRPAGPKKEEAEPKPRPIRLAAT
jgi:hypothetical protein